MSEELKRCPFCGSAPKMSLLGNPPSLITVIQCSQCRCDLHWYGARDIAISIWNLRAPDPVCDALAEALRKILSFVNRTADSYWKPKYAEALKEADTALALYDSRKA